MDGQPEAPKKRCVPLEDALDATGTGLYVTFIMTVTGLVQFSGVCAIQGMSIIIPAAGPDLGLTGFDKGILTSIAFSGMIFSSFVFGSFADQFGRRRVMLYCSFSNAVLALLASFAPTSLLLIIVWFCNGFLLGGVFSPAFVYVTEFSPMRVRARSVILPTCLGSLASVYLPVMAWFILPLNISIPIYGNLVYSSWRLFLALLAVPTAISSLLLYNLPESPKYTLNKGNEEETLDTLRKLYALNHKKSKSDFPFSSVCLDLSDQIASPKWKEGENFLIGTMRMLTQQLTALFMPPILLYTCLSCCMLCGFVGIYNTLYLWLPEQMKMLMERYTAEPDYRATLCQVVTTTNTTQAAASDSALQLNVDIYLVSIVTGLLQTLILVVISFVADKLGRKRCIVAFSGLSVGGCVALLFVNQFYMTVIAMCLTAVTLATTFPLGLSIVVDFFPTSLRSSAVSIAMLFGRIGASLGGQAFGLLYQVHCEQLYWGIIAIIFGSIFLNILTPSKRKT